MDDKEIQFDELIVKYIAYVSNTFPGFILEKPEYEINGILYEFETLDGQTGKIEKSDNNYLIKLNELTIEELNEVEYDLIKPDDSHSVYNILDWINFTRIKMKAYPEYISTKLKYYIENLIKIFLNSLSITSKVKFENKPINNNFYATGEMISNEQPMFHTITTDPYDQEEGVYTIISTFVN